MAIVLAITTMLTSIAVTNFTEQIPHRQLREASVALAGELRLARQKAISKGADETISFNIGEKTYGTQTLPSHVNFGRASNVPKLPSANSASQHDAEVKATFYPDGTGEMGTIYLTNSKEESVAITVNITGRVKKYLWNGHD
ncbi:MAG: GspH/FimT family pseudopilin, partial [Nitrospirae bacterium]|nr:GspH/FimT family pseudopilin [Candidatus Troglogloeales bacterium]